jgi:hypothetical protein
MTDLIGLMFQASMFVSGCGSRLSANRDGGPYIDWQKRRLVPVPATADAAKPAQPADSDGNACSGLGRLKRRPAKSPKR